MAATASAPVKPTGQKSVGQKPGQKKARKPMTKRTMVEFREFLLARKLEIQQANAIRIGKIDMKVAAIDEKYASRVAAAEARNAALADGKTVEELDAELAAQIKALQLTKRMIKKI